jgi:hypothetical protein
MWTEIRSLVGHVNDLQEAVEGMLLVRRGDDLSFRHFLAALHDDDFGYLMGGDFNRKVLYLAYLARRFALYCNGLR